MTAIAEYVTTRRRMPSMATIADYWYEHAAEVFPTVKGEFVGWGEPFCFRCGWLTPLPAGDPPPSKKANPFQIWNRIGGWLERAHLHDRQTGGPDSPANLVPLCPSCHRAMPMFADGPEDATAWVTPTPAKECDHYWQLATEVMYGGDRYVPYPGWNAMHAFRVFVDEQVRDLRLSGAIAVSPPPVSRPAITAAVFGALAPSAPASTT